METGSQTSTATTTGLELPAELRGIELDPEKAARLKQRRLYRLNTVTIPLMRFLGFGLLSVGIYLYLLFFRDQAQAASVALGYAAASLLYSVAAWLTLRAFYKRWRWGDLAVIFLALDVVLHVVAIYVTGGEESWLVALLLLRMADQATTGLRRAFFFTNFNVLCFLGLTAYLGLVEGRDLDWGREMTKAALLYAAGIWITVTARGGDRRRRRVSAAIEATRKMVRELEAQAHNLDEERVRAEAASRAKSQFLANMSHELRTPLSAVVGGMELMESEDLSTGQRDQIELLQDGAESLLHIVDNILDYSSLESGGLELDERPCQVQQVVESVVRLLEHQASKQGVEIRADVPADLPEVVADSARLRQVLLTLVANAVKFTQEGSIEVRLRYQQVERRLRLRFEVEDTGIGISDADRQRLFEPFTQADTTSSRSHGGVGIGLAFARRLIDLMGGRIGVSSRVGVGSRFFFELDLDRAKTEASEAQPPAGRFDCRVLVVEDNPMNSAVAEAMLNSLGVTVEIVTDGRQAVEAVSDRCFDLVFMDCQMPVMDGYQATEEIRRLEEEGGRDSRRTPIVALTAHALAEERERCLAVGMDEHVAKPVRTETLARVLTTFVGAGAGTVEHIAD